MTPSSRFHAAFGQFYARSASCVHRPPSATKEQPMRPPRVRMWLAATLGVAALSACAAPEETPPPAPEAPPPPAAAPVTPIDDRPLPPPFEALPPAVYVAKVKSLLTGLPPTEAELEAVTADRQ